MKSAFRFLVLILLVGGWSLAALGLHVIVAPPNGGSLPARVVVLPKDRLGLDDTYVDTRAWTLNDAASHPTVVKRLLAVGKADVLGHVVQKDPKGMSVEAILADAVERGPQDQAAPTSAPSTTAPASVKHEKNESLAQRASASTSAVKSSKRVTR
jgi:hypothetical protein